MSRCENSILVKISNLGGHKMKSLKSAYLILCLCVFVALTTTRCTVSKPAESTNKSAKPDKSEPVPGAEILQEQNDQDLPK